MENYFYKVSKDHYAGKLLSDAHPEHAYQVILKKFIIDIFKLILFLKLIFNLIY